MFSSLLAPASKYVSFQEVILWLPRRLGIAAVICGPAMARYPADAGHADVPGLAAYMYGAGISRMGHDRLQGG